MAAQLPLQQLVRGAGLHGVRAGRCCPDDRFFAATFETLWWTAPPCSGLFIAIDRERQDGAVMEIGMSLGVFVGGAYLLTVLLMAGISCWNAIRGRDTFLSSCGAIVAALALSLVAGNVAVGETGLFWVAVGFCLAARSARDTAVPVA